MNGHLPLSETYRLALPCYKNRVMPRFGIARAFIFADIESETKQITGTIEQSWEPNQGSDLPTWLQQKQVTGILCGGIHPRFQIALEAAGIWVVWGFRGEIDSILHQWLTSDTPETLPEQNYGFVSCCRLPQILESKSSFRGLCKRRKKS